MFRPLPYDQRSDTMELWLRKNLQLYEEYLDAKRPRVAQYTAAPINPEEGDIVRADGTSWNPGSGGGFYGYHGGAWVFLG